MDTNTVSLDEQLIFDALMNCDGMSQKLSVLEIDDIPESGKYQQAALKISDYSERMMLLKENYAAREIICYKKILRPFIVFFRKVVRKFVLKWYVEPICERQTDFNTATYKMNEEIASLSEKQLILINELYGRCSRLEHELEAESAYRKRLEQRLIALEGRSLSGKESERSGS